MSDEEKKVIDLLKNIDKQKCVMLECPVVKNNIERQLKIIELNRIIRKQSKEIAELKAKNKILEAISLSFNEIQDRDKKWEDKIKAIIEELNNKLKNADEIEAVFIIKQQQVLQSLLEKE